MLNCFEHIFTKSNTLCLIICMLSKCRFLAVFFMNVELEGDISMLVISLQPRDANSKLIAPVPEKRSKNEDCSKSSSFVRILNNPSLAKSVVGLALYSDGGVINLPLSSPPIILIYFLCL